MAEFEESLEELKAKQNLYEEQLQQVEDALKQEETEDLKRLQADLKEVIQLTRHLVEYKQQQEQQLTDPSVEAAAAAAAAAVAAAAAAAPQESSTADKQPSPAVAAPREQQQAAASRTEAAATPATAAVAHEQHSSGGPLVGRTCSAEYEGKRYYASIVEVKRDPKEGERVVVDFIGWGNREEYPLQQVVLLPQASATDFPVGTSAQAIYSGDG
ncbi:uncharacterized protein EMH_0069280 [Eimeria mitis]|uniref:Tudor domain-containing protein n=1 Tax=Eimeria mitis TaxID=44415 RepID=U6K8C3_9EIME|nr:uncharacterized protein EMH_0043800 [Eimeria mitis]XP_013354303.1 uncharacterized protein EMH_0069280 [Eimeria mitis]CDJ28771.1 hypothetical protein EMH_0043800 [Eimeria mitis]CDJ31738.1 hypothetical protein, conserved [Eimeria mitis]